MADPQNLHLALRFDCNNRRTIGTRDVKSSLWMDYKHAYKLCEKLCS